jgi:hypothetical protein
MITCLDRSLVFWVDRTSFNDADQRRKAGFVYVDLNDAKVMLGQVDLDDG